MKSYRILRDPGHNRVYFDSSSELALAELTLAIEAIGGSNAREVKEAGVSYMAFDAEEADDEALKRLARLSFAYAVFEKRGELLAPMELPPTGAIDRSVGEILRYPGKTNELFTRTLIDMALLTAEPTEGPVSLLDPFAGKGTTLFEGLAMDMNVFGVEINDKAAAEGYDFFKKYLERGRYKHSAHIERLGTDKGRAVRRSVELNGGCRFELVSGDSTLLRTFYKKNSFDIAVTDLPYGVKHGSVTGGRSEGRPTRNPDQLLRSCAPGILEVLRRGGAAAFAWNSFLLSREELRRLLEEAGFIAMRGGVYETFEHRVDQAIRRDIVLARKP